MVDFGERRLRYPLTYAKIEDIVTPDTPPVTMSSLEGWPASTPDERINITLNLSLNEYVALASSIDVGGDIAYGTSIYVWWIWTRALISMNLCDDVADCVANSQALQNAITNYLLESGVINNNSIDADNTTINDRFPIGQRQQDITSPPSGCDKDILWSGCLEIVTRLDDEARQILESAIIINDVYERYKNIVGVIPIIGDLAEDIAENFTEVIPDLYNSFNAYSSQSNIESLACSLFELVCNDCKYPTFEQLADTVATNSFGALLSWESVSLATVVSQFLSTGAYTPTLVWHSFLLLELFTIYVGASFNGSTGTKTIAMWAKLGEDIPSNDWETLCTGCNPPTYPTLEIGRCSDAFVAGTLTQLSANQWQLDSQYFTPPGVTYAVVQRVGGGAVQFTSVNIEIAPPAWSDSLAYSVVGCGTQVVNDNPSIGWLNRTDSQSYYTAVSGNNPFRLTLTVAPI